MSNLLSSGNVLMLAGVVVLAVIMVILAIWVARTSGRVSNAVAQMNMLDKRLKHVEDFLSHHSARAVDDVDDDYEDEDIARGADAGRTTRSTGRVRSVSRGSSASTSAGMTSTSAGLSAVGAASRQKPKAKARKSKRDMVVPSGAAKPAPETRAARPSVQGGSALGGKDRAPARQSMSQDARRRREERHQAQIRRQAEAIVQEHIRQSGSLDEER